MDFLQENELKKVVKSFPNEKEKSFYECLMALDGTMNFFKVVFGRTKLMTIIGSGDANALARILLKRAPLQDLILTIKEKPVMKRVLSAEKNVLLLLQLIKQTETNILSSNKKISELIMNNDKDIESLFMLYQTSGLNYETFKLVCDTFWTEISFEDLLQKYREIMPEKFFEGVNRKHKGKLSGSAEYKQCRCVLTAYLKRGLPIYFYCHPGKQTGFNSFEHALDLAMDFEPELYLQVKEHMERMDEFYKNELYDCTLAFVPIIKLYLKEQSEKNIAKLLTEYINNINLPYDDFIKLVMMKAKEPGYEELSGVLIILRKIYKSPAATEKMRRNLFNGSYNVEMYDPEVRVVREKVNGVTITEDDYNLIVEMLHQRGIPSAQKTVYFAVRKLIMDKVLSLESGQETSENLDDFLDYLMPHNDLVNNPVKVLKG